MPGFTKSRVTKIVTFRLTVEQAATLEDEAKRRGDGIADVLRAALNLYFERSAPGSAGSTARPSRSSRSSHVD